MSWINDLDALASAGVIGFDAPAYIKGVQPRYYGNPSLETLPDTLPQMNSQPKADEFKSSSTGVNNPSWKKWGIGILATAGLLFGASKFKTPRRLFRIARVYAKRKIPRKIATLRKKYWAKFVGIFSKKTTPKP